MSRKFFIIGGFITLIIVITAVIFLAKPDREKEPAKNTEELLTTSRLSDNRQLVENAKFHYAFKVPSGWKVQLIGDDVAADFSTPAFQAEISVNSYSNIESINLREWVESNKPSEVSEIVKDGKKGLRYTARESAEGYKNGEIMSAVINSSYVLGNIFELPNQAVLDIRCSISGVNYEIMIPTCEEIVKSLHFTQ